MPVKPSAACHSYVLLIFGPPVKEQQRWLELLCGPRLYMRMKKQEHSRPRHIHIKQNDIEMLGLTFSFEEGNLFAMLVRSRVYTVDQLPEACQSLISAIFNHLQCDSRKEIADVHNTTYRAPNIRKTLKNPSCHKKCMCARVYLCALYDLQNFGL